MCTLFWELHGLAAHQAGNDLMHLRFGTGIVGLVQNGLLLVFLHGGVSLHGRRIHGQSQAEADGNFVKIHCNHPPGSSIPGLCRKNRGKAWRRCLCLMLLTSGEKSDKITMEV